MFLKKKYSAYPKYLYRAQPYSLEQGRNIYRKSEALLLYVCKLRERKDSSGKFCIALKFLHINRK